MSIDAIDRLDLRDHSLGCVGLSIPWKSIAIDNWSVLGIYLGLFQPGHRSIGLLQPLTPTAYGWDDSSSLRVERDRKDICAGSRVDALAENAAFRETVM